MKRKELHKQSPTAHGRHNVAGRLLLLTLLLFTFVGGARAQHESHWPDFDSNDNPFDGFNTVIAAIQINGEYIYSEHLEFAAYVDGECRGHAFMADFTNKYGVLYPIVEMNIYYYNNSCDEVSFKMYDHTDGVLYENYEVSYMGNPITIHTGEDHIEGRYDHENPIILNFTTTPTTLTQTIQLAEGWNWVSFNVDITLEDLKAALLEALPGNNITIHSQSYGSTTYNGNRWRGSLNNLDLSQMYMINVPVDCEIMLEGTPINPADHPVTINKGDNWIAFPLSQTMSVTDAFAGFAVAGDMVISQTAAAVFIDNNRWRGKLATLQPGQGYIYYSNVEEDRIFVFPEAQSGAGGDDNNNSYDTNWPDFNYHKYQFNRPFVAAIQIDNEIITDDDENWDALEVAAFVGDECRAKDMYLYYVAEWEDPFPILNGLPIYYNYYSGEVVSFKMYDHVNGVEYENCEVSYMGNPITIHTGEERIEGYINPENPIILRFTTSSVDVLELADDDSELDEKNTAIISENHNSQKDVKLAGRTLWKNDQWNTICLPFDVSIEESEFQDATVMELDTEENDEYEHVTGFEGGSLYLNFKEVETGTMAAGKPYIVKWEGEDDLIDDPIFYDVTIQNVDPAAEDYAVTSADQTVTFKGIFSAMKIEGEDKTMLYLGGEDNLFYPNPNPDMTMTIGAFRAYFQLNGITAGEISDGVRLNFGGSEASGIRPTPGPSLNGGEWFDLQGRKLQGKPTRKGLYIHGGRKAVVK